MLQQQECKRGPEREVRALKDNDKKNDPLFQEDPDTLKGLTEYELIKCTENYKKNQKVYLLVFQEAQKWGCPFSYTNVNRLLILSSLKKGFHFSDIP